MSGCLVDELGKGLGMMELLLVVSSVLIAGVETVVFKVCLVGSVMLKV